MRRLPLVAALVAASLGLSAPVAVTTTAQAATARTVMLRTYAVYPQAGASITVVGSLSSSPAGSPVTIQELRSSSWTDLGTAATDAKGDYAFTFTPASGGTKSYRAVARATSELAAATSSTLTRSVHSAPSVPFDQAPVPKVNGTHTVGSLLSVDFGTWTPNATLYAQWARDGTLIPRASGYRYRLTAQDLGKHMTVVVSAFRSDSRTVRESKPGEAVRPGTFTTKPPAITGTAAIGQPVKAEISDWSPQPTTLGYRWMRGGTPIAGATAAEYTITPQDAGSELSVEVRGEAAGYAPATRTSDPVPVPGTPPASAVDFGDVMRPASTSALPADQATVASGSTAPQWGTNKLTRWDASGAFTHSLDPQPMGTLYSDYYGYDITNPAGGAEYVSTNSIFKNADISFEFTGRRFAIEYRTHSDSDAMVWIDGKPVSGSPIVGRDASTDQRGTRYWITVTLPERRTATVRFAGPYFFTGVHTPVEDNATISKTSPPLTVGVIGDSFFDMCVGPKCMSRAAGPALSTLTGFRIWNLAEKGTGYINDGSRQYASQTGEGRGIPGHTSSPYGSARHLAAIKDAPLDALLVNGTLNDTSAWSPTAHREAVETFLEDVKATRPDLPVVLVGIESLAIGRTPTRLSHYRALTSNFAGMLGRHSNVVGVIDPYTDPWLTGTGSTTNPKGDGNQDLYVAEDGAHLTGEGQMYYQGKIASALTGLPLPQNP